jgi:hypothetical protein
MTQRRIENWTWILIFGGLIGSSIGVFAHPRDAALGLTLISAGLVAVAIGVALIVLRSRQKD